MPLLRFLLCVFLVFSPAAAAVPEWRQAPEYEVRLSSYDIEPEEIRLPAGQPVRLRLVNNSNQTHSFSARSFFQAARLRSRDTSLVTDGKVIVRPGQSRTIYLVPAAGRFGMNGGSLFRRVLGMGGHIVVE